MKHETLKNPRHGCDLHGALQTVEALYGAVPVVHANAGCVYQHYLAGQAELSVCGGVCGPEVPATEVIEKQIVFGGASRLREQIKNTAKVIDGDLYVILGSCEAAMVADDIAAMTREAREVSIPAVFYFSAGFKGGAHWGYANLMKEIFRQLGEVKKLDLERTPGLVNVLGVLPKTDPFYKGDLREIKRLLEAAGLCVNIFFGPEGTAELKRSVKAEQTLVFSRWGIPAALQLEEQYGIPFMVFDSLPLGMESVKSFYGSLASRVHLDEECLREFLSREEQQYRYLLDSLRHAWYAESLRKTALLAGDAACLLRLAPFLRETLGIVINTAVITDARAGGTGETPPPFPGSLADKVFQTADSAETDEIIAASGTEMVLGGALEAPAAARLGIPHMIICAPNSGQALLHKTYAGLTGIWFFLEDYAAAVLRNNAEREAGDIQFLRNLSH